MSRTYLRALLAALLLGVVATSAWAAASSPHPYRITPARRCLIRHDAHITTHNTPGLTTLIWYQGHPSAGNPGSDIAIAFYPSPAAGLANERQDRHTFQVTGFSATWIRHHLMRRQNVVVTSTQQGLTTSEIATIVACLRP